VADLTTTNKPTLGALDPVNADESGWDGSGPLPGVSEIRDVHLFGIPLVSGIRHPLTKMFAEMSDNLLQRFIRAAVDLAEAETGADLFPRQYVEGHPYDMDEQRAFGYMMLRHRPGSAIQKLDIVSSDGVNVWDVPLAWIQTDYLYRGQIQLMPFAVAAQSGVAIPLTSPSGAGLLPSIFRFSWVPALWRVTYTAGYPDGMLPGYVRQLIGTIAAMEVLSALAATYSQTTSASLSLDGLGQSSSGPGPERFKLRMDELAAKRKWLVGKIQAKFGMRLFAGNI